MDLPNFYGKDSMGGRSSFFQKIEDLFGEAVQGYWDQLADIFIRKVIRWIKFGNFRRPAYPA